MAVLIGGGYQFRGREPFLQLQILFPVGKVSGEFYGVLSGDGNTVAIAGNYNEATLEVTFNDALQPDELVGTTLFTGMAVPEGPNGRVALAGTWTEQAFTLVASGGSGKASVNATKVAFQVAYKKGVWLAVDRLA